MQIDRIIIITRETRLEDNIKRFNTKKQAQFVIEKRGQSFADYELEYDNYQSAQETLFQSVPRDYKFVEIDRSFLPNYLFGPNDLVVTLGQDGLVSNTAKYLDGQPLVALNPDPERFDGVLLPFHADNLPDVLKALESGSFGEKNISMARVGLQDGQELFAFNDFFIGASAQISARYTIKFQEQEERHISSGLVVSTPAGSTGWMSSFFNMSRGMNRFLGLAEPEHLPRPDWEARQLMFMVREPFRSNWSGADIVAGNLGDNEELVLESHMAEKGVIFSDGMIADFLNFNSGATATISLAEKKTRLISHILGD